MTRDQLIARGVIRPAVIHDADIPPRLTHVRIGLELDWHARQEARRNLARVDANGWAPPERRSGRA